MVEKMTSSFAKATYVIVGNGIAGVTAAAPMPDEKMAEECPELSRNQRLQVALDLFGLSVPRQAEAQ